MDKIKPLISTREVLNKAVKTEKTENSGFVSQTEHEFFVSNGYKDFAKQLTSLEKGKSYHFVSFGQWSLKHIVFHIISLIGKCDVFATTYGLGPSSARGIVSALQKGQINSFNFLYDHKIKNYKVAAHDLCVSNFPVKIANIHAKVTVLQNADWGITITGSANWSDSNNKIEYSEITVDNQFADFNKSWISKSMQAQSTEAKKILDEIQLGNIR